LPAVAPTFAALWPELTGACLEPVTEGMSGALVFRASAGSQPVRYLKIAEPDAEAALQREVDRTQWLDAQGVCVPAILRVETLGGRLALLTQAIPGTPAATSELSPNDLAEVLGRGMAILHRTAASSCPFDESVAVRLMRAARDVASGSIEPAHFDPRNRGVAPEALLARLQANPPSEDIVVVHGDATLTNLIIGPNGSLGFVDCGHSGRGDRYIDLAVLATEIEEHHGREIAMRFIRAYGLDFWHAAKAQYFSDLYELF
jgi:aminoglycoside 3'-phosphotransferase-2